MFRPKFLLTLSLVLLLAAGPALAQGQRSPAKNVKAAYVNMQKVLQSTDKYKSAMKDLKEYRSNLEQQIKDQRKELQKMQKNLQQEGSLLSAEQRQQKQQELQRKMQSLQQRAQQSQQMMQQKRQELLQPVLEEIDPVVRSVAEDQGYNVIYSYGQRDNPSVLWVSEDLNITDDIVDRLESNE